MTTNLQTQIRRTAVPDQLNSLVGRMAAEYGVDKAKLYSTLANSIFAQGGKDRNGSYQVKTPTPEEMMSLLIVADRFKLDPFTKQIFAFSSRGKVVPIVSVDGWLALLNRQPDYDGLSVEFSNDLVEIGGVKLPEFCQVSIFRKSLTRPVVISEYATEVFQPTEVWKKYPRRMMRHKAIIQCARIAFSISGIYDREEAENIVAGTGEDVIDIPVSNSASGVSPSTASTASTTLTASSGALPKAVPARRSISFKSKEEIDAALESAVKSAVMRNNWSIAEQWVNSSLEGTQREYGLAYLEDRRARLAESGKKDEQIGEAEAAPAPETPAVPTPRAPVTEEPPMPPAPSFDEMPY